MFKTLINAWNIKDVRKKLIYIFIALIVYRFGAHIYLPGLDLKMIMAAKAGAASQQNLFSIIAGGGYASIFAMGIGPYITSSIIFQLLTVAIPKLEQIKKEGEEGRKKIDGYTRIGAIVLAIVQGSAYIYSLHNMFVHKNWFAYIISTIAIVTGTMFVMWLGEFLTEFGIGNGSSFIIFANILSGLPTGVMSMYLYGTGGDFINWIKIGLLLVLFVCIICFVVWVQAGERRIPVQYSKKMVGQQYNSPQNSFIPIKVNIAGVMSIIFAISLLQFPSVVHQVWKSVKLEKLMSLLSITNPVGTFIYVFLIFCFTFFYTSFAINPIEMSENMKKSGGFIPGIRPGKPTSEYIQVVVDRLSWIGALFYSIIAIMPVIFQWIFGFKVGFGGTTLLIVTGVALEIIKQLESQLLMRHYKGFLS